VKKLLSCALAGLLIVPLSGVTRLAWSAPASAFPMTTAGRGVVVTGPRGGVAVGGWHHGGGSWHAGVRATGWHGGGWHGGGWHGGGFGGWHGGGGWHEARMGGGFGGGHGRWR